MSYRKKHIGPKIKHLRPKESVFKKRSFWIFLISWVSVLLMGYLVAFMPFLQISDVAINGNIKVPGQEIQTLAWQDASITLFSLGDWHLTSRSILLVRPTVIQQDILRTFPMVASASIQRRFPSRLDIAIQERVPVSVACDTSLSSSFCTLVDHQGIAFEPVSAIPQGMVVIKKALDARAVVGTNIIDPKVIDSILRTDKQLQDNFQVAISDASGDNPLVLTTTESWKLYLDPNGDIDLAIKKLNLLLKDEISIASRKKLQYIYLQYKDKAYYQ